MFPIHTTLIPCWSGGVKLSFLKLSSKNAASSLHLSLFSKQVVLASSELGKLTKNRGNAPSATGHLMKRTLDVSVQALVFQCITCLSSHYTILARMYRKSISEKFNVVKYKQTWKYCASNHWAIPTRLIFFLLLQSFLMYSSLWIMCLLSIWK